MSHEYVPQLKGADNVISYRAQLHTLLHDLGKGVKRPSKIDMNKDRATVRYAGMEYMSPGSYMEVVDTDGGRSEVQREWKIVASHKDIGMSAHKLSVIETDTKLREREYHTARKMYRICWDDSVGIYTAQVKKFEIVSQANADGEIIETDDGRKIVSFEIDSTEVAQQREPFRYTPDWEVLTNEDFEVLRGRTRQYGRELLMLAAGNDEPRTQDVQEG